jgi:hypothetical protein
MNTSSELPKKKAYQTPNLFNYGNLTGVTAGSPNMSSAKDGGSGSTQKTV